MPLWRWAAVLLCAPLTYAQSGVLTGKAHDSHNLPVPNIQIYLLKNGQHQPLTTKTDSAGVYRFTAPVGTYVVRAEGEATSKTVVITETQAITLDLVVTPPQFFDEPQFTVAGVTDNTYRGGHGSDNVLRSSEDLDKATASLASKNSHADEYERSGHPMEAVRELQRAAEADPSEPNLFNWGTELLSHRAPQAAIEIFSRGVRLFPTSTRMLLGLATSHYEAGSYAEAEKWFLHATDLDPSNPTPYLFLGKVQAKEITHSAGYEERMARFAKLLPTNARANYYYASCLWASHRSPEALSLLDTALKLDPNLGIAYLQRGIIQAADQRYADAITSYQRAIAATPDLEEAHYRLSEAYRVTGNKSRAEQELAIFQQLSQQSSKKLERERQEVQQFVIALRQTDKPQ